MNRLKAYRDIEGINQAELGEILELSVPMISAIESGRRPFNGDLEQLGYRSDRFALSDMSEPLHRARASTAVAARKRAKELIRLAGEVFAELIAITPKSPEVQLHRLPPVQGPADIEDRAAELRAMLAQEEDGPIRNMTAAVERAGVCLVPIAGLPGIDALSSWVNGIPVIGIDPTAPGDRFRFGIGHECGHLIFHTRQHDGAESEANRFAGSLLFPRSDFESAMTDKPKLQNFVSLKNAWGMSVAAIVYRAHELEFVDDARYRALQIQMSKWHRNEPGEFQPVHGTLFQRLVAVNGGAAEVARRLGVNAKHLSILTNWSHLRLA